MSIQWLIQDFPEEGPPILKVGAPTYYFAQFPQKLHENLKNLDPEGEGACPWYPLLDPRLLSKEGH